jgi:hypothetical protein
VLAALAVAGVALKWKTIVLLQEFFISPTRLTVHCAIALEDKTIVTETCHDGFVIQLTRQPIFRALLRLIDSPNKLGFMPFLIWKIPPSIQAVVGKKNMPTGAYTPVTLPTVWPPRHEVLSGAKPAIMRKLEIRVSCRRRTMAFNSLLTNSAFQDSCTLSRSTHHPLSVQPQVFPFVVLSNNDGQLVLDLSSRGTRVEKQCLATSRGKPRYL